MKKLHYFNKLTFLLLFFFILFTSGGVYAMFQYAEGPIQDQVVTIDKDMVSFAYLYPNTPEGRKQEALVDNLLNGTDQYPDIGLNNPDSRINTIIKNRAGTIWGNRNTLGSMDAHEKDTLSQFFDDETIDMTFLVYFPNGTSGTYYIFTTPVDLGTSSPNIPYGDYIYPIYRTTLQKNADGKYEAVKVEVGEAISAKYSNYLGSLLVTAPSFNASSWRKTDN